MTYSSGFLATSSQLSFLVPSGSEWGAVLVSAVLVMVRLSGLMVFAPIFSSAAIAPRIKTGFVLAMTLLLAPIISRLPGARLVLDLQGIIGELAVGLTIGFTLGLLNEALTFSSQLLGMQFSFSLVNLVDPNSMIETPVLGQLLGWISILVLLGAGLDRSLLAAVMRSFAIVPAGKARVLASTGPAIAEMTGGLFVAGLQLAAPVMAAAMTVEMAVGLMGKLSPQLPVMVVGVPLKTLVSYLVLIGSLAVWPGWMERHFALLLVSTSTMVKQ